VKFGRKNTPNCTIGKREEVLDYGKSTFRQLKIVQTVKDWVTFARRTGKHGNSLLEQQCHLRTDN